MGHNPLLFYVDITHISQWLVHGNKEYFVLIRFKMPWVLTEFGYGLRANFTGQRQSGDFPDYQGVGRDLWRDRRGRSLPVAASACLGDQRHPVANISMAGGQRKTVRHLFS